MKMLLASCSLLAGCLFSFLACAQYPALAVTSAVPPVNAGPTLTDSLPSGETGIPGVLKIITDRDRAYHGHLLIKKVPGSYNGHLLVKTPDDKNRHLRVVPAPGAPENKNPRFRKNVPDLKKFRKELQGPDSLPRSR